VKTNARPKVARPSFSLGIDLGRTWLRACLADSEGRVLRRGRLPAVPWQRLPEVMPRLRRQLRFRLLSRLTLGSTGLWAPATLAAARRLLRPWARRVAAVSDVELAHAAAFGAGAGVLVVAGTGSIAVARDRQGHGRRTGGWGQLLGDEGSGFWIGRAALRDSLLRRRLGLGPPALPPTPESVRAVARLAPKVLRLARIEPRARRVRGQAARHLALLAKRAGQGLSWDGPIPVCCWGGVFRDRALAAQFQRALGRRRHQILRPRMEADVAAAVLNIDLISARG